MQALVDSNYLLRDIVVGWPGSVHEAQVISDSQMYALGCSGRLFLADVKEEVLGQEIHPVILADRPYPMLNLLLKGQPHTRGLLLDDFQNGNSLGESPGKAWANRVQNLQNLGDFYHVTFLGKPIQNGGKASCENELAVKIHTFKLETLCTRH